MISMGNSGRMRIAMLIQNPLFFGGGEVHAYEISKVLSKKGHYVTIFHPSPPQKIDNLRTMSYAKFQYRRVGGLASSLALVTSLLSGGYDIIHIHGVRFSSLSSAVVVKKLMKTSIVLTFHSFGRPSWYEHPVKHALIRWGIQNTDAVITVSESLKQEILKSLGQMITPIFKVYNGVDINRFNPDNSGKGIRKKLGIENKYVMLYVGRLKKIKGLTYLIRAMPIIVKKAKDVTLVIAGRGRLIRALQKLVEKLNVERHVMFVGFISPDRDLPYYYAACDVFVLPSTYEVFPLALLEAMSTGKPVIASRIGGIPKIVRNGENGFLTKPRDPAGIAKAVLRLYNDADLASSMGKAGRRLIEEKFSWQKIAKQIERIYEILLYKNQKMVNYC